VNKHFNYVGTPKLVFFRKRLLISNCTYLIYLYEIIIYSFINIYNVDLWVDWGDV
jgi:hypothetical protein